MSYYTRWATMRRIANGQGGWKEVGRRAVCEQCAVCCEVLVCSRPGPTVGCRVRNPDCRFSAQVGEPCVHQRRSVMARSRLSVTEDADRLTIIQSFRHTCAQYNIIVHQCHAPRYTAALARPLRLATRMTLCRQPREDGTGSR